MPQNFIDCNRGIGWVMPPSLADWVPEDHLVWTILGSVDQMDLSAIYGTYRPDGHGRPAYEPSMMVSLLLYSYSRGVMSSRGIERECVENVAFKLITANTVPDHSTIAEFRRRHEQALSDLFDGVLQLCGEAGLVSVGVIAIDGTKIKANAHRDATRSYQEIAREILKRAEELDREEDEQHGRARGDELPQELCTPEARRAALAAAKRRLEQHLEAQNAQDRHGDGEEARGGDGGEDNSDHSDRDSDDEGEGLGGLGLEFDAEMIVASDPGRRGWARNAQRQLARRREQQQRPVARDRDVRLLEAARRLEEDLEGERAAMDAYEAYCQTGRDRQGRRVANRSRKPYALPDEPQGSINLTDPDSRVMKTVGQPGIQGYNAQAAINERQIVIAAEVMCRSGDFGNFAPMVTAVERGLRAAGIDEDPDAYVADAGYWNTVQMTEVEEREIEVLIPPDSRLRTTSRPGWDKGPYEQMRERLETDHGRQLYKRRQNIEPVFGQIKFNRKIIRFLRRGHAAVRCDWRLVTATHNLLKLHSHWIAAEGA